MPRMRRHARRVPASPLASPLANALAARAVALFGVSRRGPWGVDIPRCDGRNRRLWGLWDVEVGEDVQIELQCGRKWVMFAAASRGGGAPPTPPPRPDKRLGVSAVVPFRGTFDHTLDAKS